MISRLLGVLVTVWHTWARWVSVAFGVWLMAAPALLGYAGVVADVHRVVGPVTASFAFIAVWQHMRLLRWMNIPLGAALLVVPWTFGFDSTATLNSLVVGLVLITLALVRGPVEQRFGGGWSAIWPGDTAERRRTDSR